MELVRDIGGALTARILSRQVSPENLHYNMHDPHGTLGAAEIRVENGRGEEVARWVTTVEQQPDGSFQPKPAHGTRADEIIAAIGDVGFDDALHFGGRAVHDAVQTTWDRLRDRDEAGVQAMREASQEARFTRDESIVDRPADGIRMHALIYADRERIGATWAGGGRSDPTDALLDAPPNARATVVVQPMRGSHEATTLLRFDLGADGVTELRFPDSAEQANALLRRELGVSPAQSQAILDAARDHVADRSREMARDAERERQERTGDRPMGAQPAAQRKPEQARERSVSEIESALAERGYRVEIRADDLGIAGPALLDGKTGERVDETDVSPEAFALAVEWNHARGREAAQEYHQEDRTSGSEAEDDAAADRAFVEEVLSGRYMEEFGSVSTWIRGTGNVPGEAHADGLSGVTVTHYAASVGYGYMVDTGMRGGKLAHGGTGERELNPSVIRDCGDVMLIDYHSPRIFRDAVTIAGNKFDSYSVHSPGRPEVEMELIHAAVHRGDADKVRKAHCGAVKEIESAQFRGRVGEIRTVMADELVARQDAVDKATAAIDKAAGARDGSSPLQRSAVQAEQKPARDKPLFSDPVHGQVHQSQVEGGVRIESQARAFRDQYERLAAGAPLPEVPSGAVLGTVAVRVAGEDGRSTTLNFATMRGTEADWRNDFVPLGTGGDGGAKAQIARDLGVSPEKADRIYESALLTSQEANRDAVREAYRDRTKEAEAASKTRDAGDHER